MAVIVLIEFILQKFINEIEINANDATIDKRVKQAPLPDCKTQLRTGILLKPFHHRNQPEFKSGDKKYGNLRATRLTFDVES